MKLATIALAIAFALPSTFALARGGMSIGSHVTRPFRKHCRCGRPYRKQTQECYRGIRLLPSRMIQADQP
jgi:hypothetical protein